MGEIRAERVLVAGRASGEILRLDEPLSLWGGLDPSTGRIIDSRHPQRGRSVRGRILVLPSGRGSSSASSILLEAVRAGTAPAAILLLEVDGILALGAAVARSLYARHPAVLTLRPDDFEALGEGVRARVEADGTLRLDD